MNRAYSLLTVKSVADEQRVITGIATTPSVDRMSDVIEPLGIQFRNPMPLLHNHRSDQPIGTVVFRTPTAKGIQFEARLPQIAEPGPLKDRVDTAWGEVKAGLIRGVSIGFRPLEKGAEPIKGTGGIRFTSTEVVELSLVAVPANADCNILTIKSLDSALLAASGTKQSEVEAQNRQEPVLTTPPGVSGSRKPAVKAPEGTTVKKSITEQIAAFEATRVAKGARMNEIMEKAAEEGLTLDAEQTEEYDTLETEVKSVDEHLVRLRRLEQTSKAAAVPVAGASTPAAASEVRGGAVVTSVKSNLPKGTAFTRYAISLMRSQGNLMQAVEIAKGWHDSTPEVETVLRAAVAAGTTTDATWAGPLVQYQNMASEFIELLRPQTILGRLNGVRRVPFNVRIPSQTGGSTAYWVGEGTPKPVSAAAFATTTMSFAKVADLVVLTDELIRYSSPSAEELIRNDLTAQIAQFLDIAFIDPSKGANAGVNPASVTNGLTAVTPSGTTAASLRTDISTLMVPGLRPTTWM
jgi:HK97 family phage major capsid protein/HK97 family phage prohead protease